MPSLRASRWSGAHSPGERGRLADPDAADRRLAVARSTAVLAMADRRARSGPRGRRRAGEAVHRASGLRRLRDRVGGVEQPVAVDAADPDGAGCDRGVIPRRSSGLDVLAPVGGPLFVGDPDPSLRVDRQARPRFEGDESATATGRPERAVGRPGAEHDVVVARLIGVVGTWRLPARSTASAGDHSLAGSSLTFDGGLRVVERGEQDVGLAFDPALPGHPDLAVGRGGQDGVGIGPRGWS